MKVVAHIEDAEGATVTVTTSTPGADGMPLVSIEHGGHTICVSADALHAAIRRARVIKGCEDEIPF